MQREDSIKALVCLLFLCANGALYSDSLTKAGAGTCILRGDSSTTLTQDLIVDAGTLQVAEGDNIGDGVANWQIDTATIHITGIAFTTMRPVILAGAALFDIDAGTTTLDGAISGAGSLTKSNTAAILVLTNGPNNYAGGTTIQGGTLSLTAVDALPNGGNLTLSNAAETVLNGHDQTVGALNGTALTSIDLGAATLEIGSGSFAGVISGAGEVDKITGGTLILTGANTYSGGTVVALGTLQGDTTSLQGATAGRNINNTAAVIFDQTFDGTFGNIINGITGTLTKQGAGKLIFSGLADQTSTTVTAGNFQLTGSLDVSTVTVNAGATFSGTGTAGSGAVVFHNFGTVAPGTSVGTLTVDGNYVQETGSTLEMEITPIPLNGDFLLVTGSVTIESGATLSLLPTPGQYNPLTPYVLVQGDGGVNSTFDTVTTSLPAFDAHVIYAPILDPILVLLLVNLVPFSILIPSGNAGVVAHCLDQIDPPEGSDLRSVTEILQFMTIPQMINTLDQMNSSLYNVLDFAQEETAIETQKAISRRFADFQRKACADPREVEGWSTFLYERTQQNAHGENVGYQTRARSVVAGFDALKSKRQIVGGLFSYSRNNLTWQEQHGFATVDTYLAGLYTGGKNRYFYGQAGALAFFDEYQGGRIVTFPTTLIPGSVRIANYHRNGWGASASLEVGCMPMKKREELHPFARADYVFAHRFAFTEHGAGSIDLDVDSHNSDLLRSEVGLQFLKCYRGRSDSLWFPHAKVGWGFQKHFIGKYSTAHFTISDCKMKVKGLNPTQSLLTYGAGLDVRGWSDHLFLGVECDGEWSKKYWGYTFSAQLKLGF